jgi:hypothetical protein
MQAASSEGDARRIQTILARLPRRIIEGIAADSITPSWQAQVFATYVVERWGAQRLVKAASGHRGERGKLKRVVALRILILSGYPNSIHLLERALGDGESYVAGAAIILLGRMGDETAAHLLVDALRRCAYAPSRIAAQLDCFSQPIPHLLRPLLGDSLPVVRFWAATLLERYAGDMEINRELASLADDPDAGVRKAVVETLGKVGGPHAVQTAVDLINDPVWYVRAHAARALGDLRRVDLCGSVISLLADREWWVRTAAKEALQAMGTEVRPELIPHLESPDMFVRNGAAEVFQNLGILDTLIAETIKVHGDDPERIELIRKILAAGGTGLIEATVGRAKPSFTPAVVRLFENAGFKQVRSE